MSCIHRDSLLLIGDEEKPVAMADSSNPEGPSGELTSGSPDSKTLPCGYEFMRHDIPLGENDCKVKSIPRIE